MTAITPEIAKTAPQQRRWQFSPRRDDVTRASMPRFARVQ